MRFKVFITVFLMTFTLGLSARETEEITGAARPGGTDNLFGTSIVFDPAHTAETIANGLTLVRQVRELVAQVEELRELQRKAERHLEKLESIPFADPENFVGAFLANMHFNLDVATEWSFTREDIEEALAEHFVGGGDDGVPIDPRFYPPDGKSFTEHYLERQEQTRDGLARRMAILNEHVAQLSRERQALARQRRAIEEADGESQHLELIAASLQQMADAQSVDRQIDLLQASQYFIDQLAKSSGEAETQMLRIEAVRAWRSDEFPRQTGGFRITG